MPRLLPPICIYRPLRGDARAAFGKMAEALPLLDRAGETASAFRLSGAIDELAAVPPPTALLHEERKALVKRFFAYFDSVAEARRSVEVTGGDMPL